LKARSVFYSVKIRIITDICTKWEQTQKKAHKEHTDYKDILAA